jgi:uncharacterized membrane protein
MSLLLKLLTVAATGTVMMWAAVPAGLALGLHPAAVAAASCAGSIAVVLLVVMIGEPARAWLIRRLGPNIARAMGEVTGSTDGGGPSGGKRSLISRLWVRYGFIGLALLAPLFPGPPAASALALALGIPGRRVLLWMSIGIILWTGGFTLAATLGFQGFRQASG